jgi:K+/H+ antiporter YhaU regulatory subunit KhtT
VAVSRAGRVFFNPEPQIQLFPSDRVVIMGPPDDLRQAEVMIHRVVDPSTEEDSESVSLVEARVMEVSSRAGKTLAQIGFRQAYGSTVIGIRRGDEYIISPGPDESLEAGDVLLVMGTTDSFERLRQDFQL